MNSLHIIGNLTRDPEMRTTQSGSNVCTFTVAVNRKKTQNNQNPGADYFRVSAWNKLGENCSKYLAKGRKVSVVGAVSVNTYTGQDGKTYANLNVMANEVEFLTSRSDSGDGNAQEENAVYDEPTGMQAVDVDDLPF